MRYVFVSDEQYEIARENGLSRDNVYSRVYILGWDVEKAITKPKKVNFCCYKLYELAKSNGITKELLYQRVVKYGMNPYEAATKKVRPYTVSKKY